MQTFQQYLAEQISRHLRLKGVDRYGLQQTLWKEELHPRVGEGKEGGGRFAPKNAPDGAPSLASNAGSPSGNAAQGNRPSQHLGQPMGGMGHLNQPQQQAQGQLPLGGMGGPSQPQAPPLPAPLQLAAQKREEILNKHFPQRQGGLFDPGHGDAVGQGSLFPDIGILEPMRVQKPPAPMPEPPAPAPAATTPAPSPVTTPADPPRRRMMGGSADSMKAQAQTAAPPKPMAPPVAPQPPAPVQTDPQRAETVPQPSAPAQPAVPQAAAAVQPQQAPAAEGQMDERAFNDMLAGNERYILALAKKHAAGTTSDPEDIAQETMMDAWQNRSQFKGSNPDDFKKWIATKVHGKFVDATRKATAKKRGMGQTRSLDAPMGDDGTATLGDTIQGASNDNAQNMMIEELHKALATLDPNMQEAIKGMFFGGKSTRELAPELGVSHETVSQRSKGAIAALRQMLEGKLNYARSRNPELFDYIDSEVDRYCRHYTLLPAKERYGSLTGNGLMGHLIRGLLTALVFGMVNGGSGSEGGQQGSPASFPSASRTASPVKPSAPAAPKSAASPAPQAPAAPKNMLQPESMPQTQTPTGWGDWLGDNHDQPAEDGDKTVPMPPMAQTQVGGTTSVPQAPDAPSEEDMAKADAMVDEAPDNDLSFMQNPAYEARQAEQSPSGQQGSLWPNWDDDSHPRHRKGDPQGRGGQFAPKNQGTTEEGGEQQAATESPQPQAAKPQSFGGTKRNWTAGGNHGSIEFSDQEHADMHELGSKMRSHMRGKGNTKGAKGVTDRERQRAEEIANHYAEKHGVSPEDIKSHALATAQTTREQAKGIGDGEHRKLNYTPFKKDTGNGSPNADTSAGDAGSPPEQPGLPQEPQAAQEPMAEPQAEPEGNEQLPPDANDGGLDTSFDPSSFGDEPQANVRIPPRHQQMVNEVAEEHGVDPMELYQYAQDNLAGQADWHEQHEAKKQSLRKSTGWNAGHIGKMENSGFDAGGERSGNKRLDELADAHGLENDEQVWSMLREGAQSLPKLGDRNYLSQMAMDLAYRKQNEQAADPAEFFRESFVDDFGQTIPFSRRRQTGSVDRRQWSMDSGSLASLAGLPSRR